MCSTEPSRDGSSSTSGTSSLRNLGASAHRDRYCNRCIEPGHCEDLRLAEGVMLQQCVDEQVELVAVAGEQRDGLAETLLADAPHLFVDEGGGLFAVRPRQRERLSSARAVIRETENTDL